MKNMSNDKRRYDSYGPPKTWPKEDPNRRHAPVNLKAEYPNPSPDLSSGRSVLKTESPQNNTGMDLSSPEFHGGRSNSLLVRKTKKMRTSQYDYSRGMRNDASLTPPIRQTASIFKQPVTVIRTQNEGKVKSDFKHGTQEKPKQLFWEKRLEALRACDVDGRELSMMELPSGLKTIAPHIADETILQSVATALHLSHQPVTGQTSSKSNMEKNPGVYLNPDQPLVQAVSVEEDDIKSQEERVLLARKKLQEALLVT